MVDGLFRIEFGWEIMVECFLKGVVVLDGFQLFDVLGLMIYKFIYYVCDSGELQGGQICVGVIWIIVWKVLKYVVVINRLFGSNFGLYGFYIVCGQIVILMECIEVEQIGLDGVFVDCVVLIIVIGLRFVIGLCFGSCD